MKRLIVVICIFSILLSCSENSSPSFEHNFKIGELLKKKLNFFNSDSLYVVKNFENNYKTIFVDSIDVEIQIISKIDSVNDCHMCPGLIIIYRGEDRDTIKLGQWGYPTSYKIIDNFMVFDSYWHGGEQSEYSIIIYDFKNIPKSKVFNNIYTSKKYIYNEDGSTFLIKCDFDYSIANDQLFLTKDSFNYIIHKNSEKEIKVSNFMINKKYNL